MTLCEVADLVVRTETSPTLREGFGVGAHTAAEPLIIFGDNPDRMRDSCANALPTGQVVA